MIEISAKQKGNIGPDSSPGNCACRCGEEGTYLVTNWSGYLQGNTCSCSCHLEYLAQDTGMFAKALLLP